ncbi:flagellin [Paenibacillus sp. UNC499MF]|uniref:flagellin N-terminal helical domain-containing protein n=1 Tax=Paenibacillus sp. UNC499MF TaxID=1502751 RepID=UPI0008A01289|nr:flagellin [Paenibacillus sp. UNC499MF]SEG75576.1 flagellin [Paenibacillus sp. UNC499MF]
MKISHNIPAYRINNTLQKNSKASSSSLEKLSSGLRINKASDDAAGLAISEKMRAQIRGLYQASRNVQDGISLIQTAEGGLQEITDILQRQRELTIRGLNDPLTDEDRRKIDTEIHQLTDEIESLSKKTSFNTMNLLARNDYKILADRSSSSSTFSASDPPPVSSTNKNIVYKPRGTPDEAKHVISSSDTSETTHTFLNTNNITPLVLPDGTEAFNEYNVDTLTTTKTDTNKTVYESLTAVNDPEFSKPAYWYSHGMNKTYFGPRHFGEAYGTMLEDIEVNGSSWEVVYTSRSNEGSDPAWDHMWFPGTNLSILRYRTLLADNSMEIRYEITNKDSFNMNINLSNIVNPPANSVITGAGGSPLPNGHTVISPPGGSSFTTTGTEANAGIQFPLGSLSPTELSIDNPAAGQPQVNFNWQLNVPSGSSVTFAFTYGPFSLNYEPFEQTQETVETKHIETTVNTDITDIDYLPPKLTIQAGANKDETLVIPLFNVGTQGLGIKDLGLLPPSIPEQALAKADGAIEKVLHYRAMYGALQNRMEHTLNNVNNSAGNQIAAESRIRDADMAKEMSTMTKSNMLMQAAQTMLAQANQHPQAVLQLLK